MFPDARKCQIVLVQCQFQRLCDARAPWGSWPLRAAPSPESVGMGGGGGGGLGGGWGWGAWRGLVVLLTLVTFLLN